MSAQVIYVLVALSALGVDAGGGGGRTRISGSGSRCLRQKQRSLERNQRIMVNPGVLGARVGLVFTSIIAQGSFCFVFLNKDLFLLI